MGNQVGVCREPPQISDLFSIHTHNDPNFGKLHDKSAQEDGFKSYLQIWRFYSDTNDEVIIKNAPIRFAQFKKFESKDCYIALHVIKNNTTEGKSMTSPRLVDSPRNTTHNPTLCDLLASSMEELTPRGTSCSFGTLSLEPFIQNTTDEFTHDLYVWNGKNSSSLAKAVALAKGFEIERTLMQDKHSGALYHHFSRTPKAALSSHFVDDLAGIKQDSRLQFDHYKYENNHIYKQLVGANRKPVSSVKIGELFGTSPDGPRYEVLKKLMHSQPNGLVATKAPSDPPTKYPTTIKVPPITKIPPLNITPKDIVSPFPKDPHSNSSTNPSSAPTVSSQTPTSTPTVSLQNSTAPNSTLASKSNYSKLNITPIPTPSSPNTAPIKATGTSPVASSTPSLPVPTPTSPSAPSSMVKVSSLVLTGISNEPRYTVPKVTSLPNLTLASTSPKDRTLEEYSAMTQTELRAIFEPVLSRILDHLFLGGQKPAMDKVMLQDAGITHVLNCAGGACKDYFPDDFIYKTYDIGDGVTEDITCLFYESLEFIEDAVRNNGKVLIHCHQGISRSSAFVICYLMWKNNWQFRQAYDFIKELRYIASPNPGFIGQLMLWRKTLDEDKAKFETRMFRVMRHSRNALVVPKQVPTPGYAALDPRGCFVIQTPSTIYYWVGEKSPSFYVEAAKRIISNMQKYENMHEIDVVEVQQHREPEEFWQSLGGAGEVTNVVLYNNDY